jgi:hypothetical protein
VTEVRVRELLVAVGNLVLTFTLLAVGFAAGVAAQASDRPIVTHPTSECRDDAGNMLDTYAVHER